MFHCLRVHLCSFNFIQLHCSVPCHTIPYHTIPYHTMFCTIPCRVRDPAGVVLQPHRELDLDWGPQAAALLLKNRQAGPKKEPSQPQQVSRDCVYACVPCVCVGMFVELLVGAYVQDSRNAVLSSGPLCGGILPRSFSVALLPAARTQELSFRCT
jgi:hypothetical protein